MDALSGLLDGGRADGAFVLCCRLTTPYAVRIEDHAPLAVVVPVGSDLVLAPDDGEPVVVHPGDVALVRGPQPYLVTDHPGTPTQVVIHTGQLCTGPEGEAVDGLALLGARSWGTSRPGAHATFVTGVYETPAQVSDRLLRALPHLTVVRAGEWSHPLTTLLGVEVAREVPGQQVVLDRLLDLLVVSAVREWFAADPARAPGWYHAQGDPVVGAVLALVHAQPERAWTLELLAREVGWSRSGVAKRFADLVGEPPMAYLTRWRLDLAADLLRDRRLTLEGVAARVGYGSAFALSTAFKRVRGQSPRDYRAG